ncbi:MAG: hypothetical protein AAGI45_16880 [Cyanobacteria bacterium P01_H01_bin.26]
MTKYILGSILAAISLMAIYGTTASDRVISWVDGGGTASQGNNAGDDRVALNDTDADRTGANQDSFVVSRTPLERAGELPQRQTQRPGAQAAQNFGVPEGTDTPEVVEAPPTVEDRTANTTDTPTNQTQNQNQNQTDAPIRALW